MVIKMSRNVKRKGSKRRRKKKLLLLFFMVLAVGLLCTLSLTVFFPVKNIEITESNFYSYDQIKEASGIKPDDNLLILRENNVLESIQQQLPFVDSIELIKKLPDTVKIKVMDAEEAFCFLINGAYYSTDKNGRVLRDYYELPQGTLFVEGNATLTGEKIKTVELETHQHSELIKTLTTGIEKLPLKAEYLDVSNLYEIKMEIDGRFTVELGEAVYLEEKLALLSKMLDSKSEEDTGVFRLDMWNPENPKGSYFENDNFTD